MTIPRWQGVLFDLDGTLVDSIPLIIASYDHALTSVLGQGRPEPEVRGWIGRTLTSVFEQEYPERAAELESTYIAWNRANAATMIGRYDGVHDLLVGLSDAQARFGVVTSKRRATAREALVLAGADDLVDVLAASEDTSEHKPLPAPLLHGAARLSVPAEGCAYVGDAVVDVQAAKAAGMTSIAVTWGAADAATLEAAAPDHLVHTAYELHDLLLGAAGSGGDTQAMG
ncbi:HAD family hydrolase [Nostocoides australiense]|uniref:Putative P-Ser-HPr phosphatase (PpaX) n=1 Tax=Nostocoides australiense Ben110 TaxID=1193182 RepID=W6K4V8_9MICO|nr:HAD-IA family hydrolase [Tetrasphaera australiensis]MCB1301121.1 HAD-IA family hydrolase [Tetrasphaera sp.]CCH75689.1 putative P-Ser-HPr phosphatase (ppaX) [Tetrasphaera australiensis Ben110]HPF80514.1 HAD-IA family hydrolase [Tetrasphaera australiensis]HRW01559.1 HAD-IA family hydrolase [Tetrasphaera sp.]